MKIINCVSSTDNPSAGTTYSVRRLVEACRIINTDTHLYSVGNTTGCQAKPPYEKCFPQNFSSIPFIKRLGVSFELRRALLQEDWDLCHIHGLWMLPNIYPAIAARAKNRPLMLSPHGMLAPEALSFSKVKKRLALALWQNRALDQVGCFRATCEAELQEIRKFGINKPVALIPNGIDIPPLIGPPTLTSSYKVISLGRIHPKKGLGRLIKAWAMIEREFPEWHLDIVGPDENGHSSELDRLINDLQLKRVRIKGPIYGDEKVFALQQAEIFVLPTVNENFAMTVAESLACCTPVISTKGAPWAGLETNRCGWWVDHGPEPLSAALREAMSLSPSERKKMGDRGRSWMQRDFGWDGIAEKMLLTYHWMVSGGRLPNYIEIAPGPTKISLQ